MELLQRKCPTCHSAVLQSHTTYATQHHGRRIIYKCANCPTYFSETKNTLMAGLKTPVSVIWQVVKARTEGMGLNAAARTFEKAKNTILAWERKFRDLHRVLFLYGVAIGRALQPFPRSKRSRHVSAHSAFQLGLSTLEGRSRRCRRRGAPASKDRHLPSSLCPLASFLTGLP